MRQSLYLALRDAIFSVPDIRSVGLWNRQTDYASDEIPFSLPAVFVEFGPVNYSTEKTSDGPVFIARGATVRLHIVSQWTAMSDDLNAWDLSADIRRAVLALNDNRPVDARFCNLRLTSSETNHDHTDILENVDTFTYTGEE